MLILKHVALQPKNQPRPVSAPPAAAVPLMYYPSHEELQVTMDKENRYKRGMPIRTVVTQRLETACMIMRDKAKQLRPGTSRVKELAKYFSTSYDEEELSHINMRTRQRKLFQPK